ncbi:hypothetical protein BDP55DRAFT_557544 [Colletotrichum godetiae]|uniref:Uncharacterized protein n=1 Tax=Colletotrichum godetiae TaxID=1209918 RepID=A0AAJ0AFD3_9PEZI|nr:uncharacterized protein BDP55DRAFT_557544 [Colletotrichum godetiae]KAK1672882.1 hypothetical protein BDP55DRAFT_557544 [Colletotrichum godetiae]
MDTAENTQHHFRSSVIRPQSNLPRPGAFSSGLSEMNESQSNTRAHPSMIPPPGASKIGSLNSAMNLKREVPKPAFGYQAPQDPRREGRRIPDQALILGGGRRGCFWHRQSAFCQAGARVDVGRGRSPVSLCCVSVNRAPRILIPGNPASSFSLDMAPESTTASSIVLRLNGFRMILWIAVHLFRSIRQIWRATIQSVPRPYFWQRLLASFPLPWDEDALSRPRSRPRNGSSVSAPTYMRCVSGRLQLWLGMQSDSDNPRSGIRLLLDAEVEEGKCYPAMEYDDKTDDRDELRCVPPNARSKQPDVARMLTRSSSKTQIISDLEMERRHHDTIRPATSPRASAPMAMNARNPPLLIQSRYTDSPGPETPTRIRDRARHTVIDQRKSLMDQ